MPSREHKPAELLVIIPLKDWRCAECDGTGDFLMMDDAGPLCLACADLDRLVFLGSGTAALTRRAMKASTLSAVVVRWSRSRGQYERQGVLVEERRHSRTPNSSASPTRTRGCAEAIARHTTPRGSGRVWRSASGRVLDEQALTLAVVASVRHEDTTYDSLLMSGVPRAEARER